MERKYFQVLMKPTAHRQLKFRSKQLGISIGAYLENLVGSIELRLSKAYDVAGIQKGLIDELLLKILIKDTLSINEQELKAELEKISRTTTTTSGDHDYKPSITV